LTGLGFCGDDCNYCPRYIATRSGDVERLKEVAALWKIIGWLDTIVSPEEMACHGWSSVNRCMLGIKECAIGKGVDNCGKCNDYPCEKMLKIFKENNLLSDNCKELLSKKDNKRFQKAFFTKKGRLDRIHKEFHLRLQGKSLK